MMRRYADLAASVGEYIDHNGERAKRWLKCGVVMRDDRSGAMSIKLDAVPVRTDWSGWFAVRNIRDDEAGGCTSQTHANRASYTYDSDDASGGA